MKISFSIHDQNQIVTHGYGQATYQMVQSLNRLGWTVAHEDPTAQVEMCFSQPYLWRWFNPDSYKIGMVAWESNKIPKTWKPGLAQVDEIWTPSPLVAEWFELEGYRVHQVYEHGIDASTWTAKRRKVRSPVRFLHIGEPAPRKGGQMAYDVFKSLFGNSDEATLTIKAYNQSTIRGKNGAHPHKELNNVKLITEEVPEELLVDLVKRHDVLVYPSYGEGFGLIPLQAMATGMPVISTDAWAPYRHLLLPELRVGSTLGKSLWDFHTGDMFYPEAGDLARAMTYAAKNFDEVAGRAFDLSKFVAKRYDWDRLTVQAFDHIKQKFDSQ